MVDKDQDTQDRPPCDVSKAQGDGGKSAHYHGIEISKEALAQFCQRHHIRRLALFGSILRDDFGPQSDVDVLVEFDPEHVPGLIRLARMEIELSEMLGRKADLRTPADLSRYFRDEVLADAEVQYAA
jgi:predicted nucleotidyltransferase